MVIRMNAAAIALALASCGVSTVQANSGALFSYDPASPVGPDNWGTLDLEGQNECSGDFNSPVAVETSKACDLSEDYVMTSGNCKLLNLGFTLSDHGVKASYPSDGSCESNTVKIPKVDGLYKALQFHIHSGSEHSIDGAFFDFELHVVHQLVYGSGTGAGPYNRTNPYAVVGFVIKKGGSTNAAFDQLLSLWETKYDTVLGTEVCVNAGKRKLIHADDESKSNKLRSVAETFDVYSLLAGKNFYTYSGGLTTPPCSEAVWWNLNTEPVVISDEQAEKLKSIITDYRNPETCEVATLANPTTGSTSRPPQDLNSRTVELYCPSGLPVEGGEPTTTAGAANASTTSSGRSLNTIVAGAASAALIATLI